MKLLRAAMFVLSLFAVAQLFAIAGDRMKQFSMVSMLGIYAQGETGEMLKLNVFMFAPMLLFTPILAAYLDRWNKAGVIMATVLFRGAIILMIPAAFEYWGNLYAIYFSAFVLSVADLMFTPARSALIPELVSEDRLMRVNAWLWGMGVVGTLGGFLLSGWLFDNVSWQSSFFTTSALYGLAGLLVLPVVISVRGKRPAMATRDGLPHPKNPFQAINRSIVDGVALIRESHNIAVSLGVQTALFAVAGVMIVIAVARVQQVGDGRALFLGVVVASVLVGLLAGAAIVSMFNAKKASQRTISVAALLAGVAVAGLARSDTLVPLSIWALVLGLSFSPAFILSETLLQQYIPPGYMGRVFAAREVMIRASYLLAAGLGTAATFAFSKETVLVTIGLVLAMLGVVLERTQWLKVEE